MLSKKMLSVWALSAVLSVPIWANAQQGSLPITQQDQGRLGVPTIKNDKGEDIVVDNLDKLPAKYCPSNDPLGWDHITPTPVGTKGWACSQLHLSGESVTSLFDKAYVNAAAPGAKNLAYDALRALQQSLTKQGVQSDAAWGQVNQLAAKLFGKDFKWDGFPQQDSYNDGGYANYNDPFSAIMFDTLNRCGCVVNLKESENTDVSTEKQQQLPDRTKLQDGCPGAAATMCAEQAERIKTGYWGTSHQYNRSFQDLANVCIYFWNSFVNKSYNAKNGVTDPNDANYKQVCSTGGVECTICTVNDALKGKNSNLPDELFCEGSTFVGPGLISYSGKDKNGGNTFQQNPILVSYDGTTCGDNTGKIDIVAQ